MSEFSDLVWKRITIKWESFCSLNLGFFGVLLQKYKMADGFEPMQIDDFAEENENDLNILAANGLHNVR